MVFTFEEKKKKNSPVNGNLTVPAMHCATAVRLFKHSSFISNYAVTKQQRVFDCTHARGTDLPRRS